MYRYVVLFLIIPFMLAGGSEANEVTAGIQTNEQSPVNLFDKANELYKQNKYEEALALYEQLLAQGIVDPVLYYNTGNAYAQLHRTGPAVLMYERALQLDPRDRDTRENLAQVAPAVNRIRVFVLLRPFYELQNSFTLNEFTTALDIVYLLLVIALLGAFVARNAAWIRVWKRTAYFGAALLFFVVCFFGVKLYETRALKEAVVMQETYARSGPSTSFSPILELPAGTKVLIVKETQQRPLPGALEAYYVDISMRPVEQPGQEWVRIRLRGGQSGYLPRSAFEII